MVRLSPDLERGIMSYLGRILILGLLLGVLLVPIVSGSGQPVAATTADELAPDASGNAIVWEGEFDPTDHDIFMWDPVNLTRDLDTDYFYREIRRLTDGPWCMRITGTMRQQAGISTRGIPSAVSSQSIVGGDDLNPDISGNTIVWEHVYSSEDTDIAILTPSGVIAPTYDNNIQRNPSVWGDTVVYEDNRNFATSGWDIYKWDPVNGETVVANTSRDEINPDIRGI